jgi:hypothetical protein
MSHVSRTTYFYVNSDKYFSFKISSSLAKLREIVPIAYITNTRIWVHFSYHIRLVYLASYINLACTCCLIF